MDHWFDRLSRPHTRRTTVRAAAVAGAAIILPGLRTPQAQATNTEPCFAPCNDAASKRWQNQKRICGTDPADFTYFLTVGGATGPIGFWSLFSYLNDFRCFSAAEVDWHRDVLACKGSECGNSGKYPGGAKEPKPKPRACDPSYEVKCGDGCCNNLKVCCQCKSGGYTCCNDAEHCEPDPMRNRGSCCT